MGRPDLQALLRKEIQEASGPVSVNGASSAVSWFNNFSLLFFTSVWWPVCSRSGNESCSLPTAYGYFERWPHRVILRWWIILEKWSYPILTVICELCFSRNLPSSEIANISQKRFPFLLEQLSPPKTNLVKAFVKLRCINCSINVGCAPFTSKNCSFLIIHLHLTIVLEPSYRKSLADFHPTSWGSAAGKERKASSSRSAEWMSVAMSCPVFCQVRCKLKSALLGVWVRNSNPENMKKGFGWFVIYILRVSWNDLSLKKVCTFDRWFMISCVYAARTPHGPLEVIEIYFCLL